MGSETITSGRRLSWQVLQEGMMATYTYTFGTPANSTFTITTSDTVQSYYLNSGYYNGYKITGIVGTFNGETITGVLADNPGSPAYEPITNDHNNSGGNIGQYYNVFFVNGTQGYQGHSTYGLDNYGLAFSTTVSDYDVYYDSPGKLSVFRGIDQTTYPASSPTSNAMACFVSGTLIHTNRGSVPVENLVVGDLALTASGEQRPIRWIGHRTIDPGRHPRPNETMPVRIRAHAFGDNRPARDLFVSPGHAICVDMLGEVLMPAASLVNGTTIVHEVVQRVTYWHVKLDSHDIILAENLTTESYIDCGNRNFFVESHVTVLKASPDASATTSESCRPYHASGGLADVWRSRLRVCAGSLGGQSVGGAYAGPHLVEDGEHFEVARHPLSA